MWIDIQIDRASKRVRSLLLLLLFVRLQDLLSDAKQKGLLAHSSATLATTWTKTKTNGLSEFVKTIFFEFLRSFWNHWWRMSVESVCASLPKKVFVPPEVDDEPRFPRPRNGSKKLVFIALGNFDFPTSHHQLARLAVVLDREFLFLLWFSKIFFSSCISEVYNYAIIQSS